MIDNPYQAPQTILEATGVLSGSRDDLRKVARFQKGILVCILIYLLAVVSQFALPPDLRPLVGVGVLLAVIVGAVFVVLLATNVFGTGLGILLGILSLVPCFGLVILLIVNGRATKILKQNGIKVGFLGADVSSI